MKFIFQFIFLLRAFMGFTQEVIVLPDPGTQTVLLDKGWNYQMGDNPDARLPSFDDHSWKPFRPDADIHDSIPFEAKTGIGWMRLRFRVTGKPEDEKLSLMFRQSIASEVYLNGQLIRKYGVVSNDPNKIRAYDPRWAPAPIDLSTDSIQVLAIKFAVQPDVRYALFYGTLNQFISVMVLPSEMAVEKYKGIYMRPWMDLFMQGILFMVFVLHLSFYLMYPLQKANLLFAFSALFNLLGGLLHDYYYYSASPDQKFSSAVMASALYAASQLLMILSVQNFLQIRTKTAFWLFAGMTFSSVLTGALWYRKGFEWWLGYMPIVTYLYIIHISITASRKKVREARILTIGFSIATISFMVFLFRAIFIERTDHLLAPLLNPYSFLYMAFLLAPPASLSIFLAYDFARTSRKLKQKLDEVEILSAKNIAVEKEKQELLSSQNVILEQKVKDRTNELSQSLQELKATQAQLIQSEKMASLGELTAGIAHEIQNPLNFVNNFTEVCEELISELETEQASSNQQQATAITKEIKQNLEKILLHGQRADSIVKGMLQHSRSGPIQKELTDINVLAEEYLRLAYHGFRARDANFNAILETNFDPSIGKSNLVPKDISRVLLNLFNNAFYAVAEKQKLEGPDYQPTVSIATRKAGSMIEISVKDNGIGISEKIKDKIFQPFFTTKPTGQGTGLGLSLSYDIIKAHGGDINIHSVNGEGSEFSVQLPANNVTI